MDFLKNFFKQKKPKTTEQIFESRTIDLKDIIAPTAVKIEKGHLEIGEKLAKTFFIFSYPRYLSTAWISPIVNLEALMNIAIFVSPVDSSLYLKQLTKKTAQVQAEIIERQEKGKVRDPVLEIAFQDLEQLRDRLQSGQERVFHFSFYITVYGDTEKELLELEDTLRSLLEGRLIYLKSTSFQQKEAYITTAPYGLDLLQSQITMNSQPLSSVFPFLSFDLTSTDGVLYGVNRHNNSLVLFDRFSLENPNFVCFGKAGSGKSYAIKLEIIRSLMIGIDVIIIDPENEYEFLSEAVDGTYFKISLTSPHHVNPFELPLPGEDERPADVLRSNIINLVGLIRLMLGGLSPEEDAIIDQALSETYAARDITPESDPNLWGKEGSEFPLISDLESVLEGMEGAESLVRRLRKFTKGSYASFLNQPSNVNLNNNLIVFGVRDMEEELRPVAMYIILRYIWNNIRRKLKKRILVVDEAWLMMKNEDSASFLFGIAKRGRKYWLGLTTITQDITDFLNSAYGQPILNNSTLQLLMKTAPTAIDITEKAFNLTQEEKYFLLEATTGDGLFFAGPKHVIISVKASYTEDQIITTSPEQVLAIKKAKKEKEAASKSS